VCFERKIYIGGDIYFILVCLIQQLNGYYLVQSTTIKIKHLISFPIMENIQKL